MTDIIKGTPSSLVDTTIGSSISDIDSSNKDGVLQLCHPGFVMSGSDGIGGNLAFLYEDTKRFEEELEAYRNRNNGNTPMELQVINRGPNLNRLISESPKELQDYISLLEKSRIPPRQYSRDHEYEVMRQYSEYPTLAKYIMRSGTQSGDIVTPLQDLNERISEVNMGLRSIDTSYPGLLDEIGRYSNPWNVHSGSSNVIVLTPTPVLNEVVRIEIDIKSGVLKLCASWNDRGNEVHIPLLEWKEKILGKNLHSVLVGLSQEFTRARAISTTLSPDEYVNLSNQATGIEVRDTL